MTYLMTYQPKDSLFLKQIHFAEGVTSDEDAAWQAKEFCNHYGYTLIDVKQDEA
jgi:hypothetical protein